MILYTFFYFFTSFYIFVEGKPLMSISQDLSIILGCNATSPVDRRNLNVALVEKHFSHDIDEDFKCFLHCLFFNYNWMDGRGAFKMEEMRNGLEESNLDELSIEYLMTTCTETEAEDKCERAYSFTQCFWLESDKLEKQPENLISTTEKPSFC